MVHFRLHSKKFRSRLIKGRNQNENGAVTFLMTQISKTSPKTRPVKRNSSLNLYSRSALLVLATFSLSLAGASALSAPEQNWPAWRGPFANGVAPHANPPVNWSETKNIRWKVKIPGRGSATPVIWENKVFIQTAIPVAVREESTPNESPAVSAPAGEAAAQEQPQRRRGFGGGGGGGASLGRPELQQFVLLCLDRRTGETIWQKTLREELPHEGHHHDHGYSSFSPVTDGEHVYVSFGSRGIYCLDFEGNVKWEKDLGQMRTRMNFGEGSSPVLHGNVLVIIWDHEDDSFIVALEKQTGEELWRQPRDESSAWTTPLIVQHEGRAEVITPGTNKVRSYDLKTGQLIWETAGLTGNVIPSAVASEDVVYVMSGFRGTVIRAIRLGHSGDLTGTDAIVWSHETRGGRGGIGPYVPSPLLHNGKLYFFQVNSGRLTCLDAKTGESLISSEPIDIPGLDEVYASPVVADGRIYFTSRDGVTVVMKPGENLDIIATNRLDENIDASPAPVGSELFLRGKEYLYCIAEQ
jgi:outer membrane protein assembly factor BamB